MKQWRERCVSWVLGILFLCGFTVAFSQVPPNPAAAPNTNAQAAQPPSGPSTPNTEKARANAARASLPPPSGLVLPLTMPYGAWHGMVMLNAMVNGNNPIHIILSTGLSHSTLSPDELPRLQVTPSSAKTHVVVFDTAVDAPAGKLDTLRIGSGVLHNVPVACVDLVSLLSHQHEADAKTCWLGANWLSAYQITFDFQDHVVILKRPETPLPSTQGPLIPFKVKNGRPIVKVTIPGAGSFDAILDTGSVGTLIPAAIAAKLKPKTTESLAVSDKNKKAGKIGRMVVPRISIGKAELKGLTVAYFTNDAPPGVDKSMAIIGIDFLRRFDLAISYARSKLQVYSPAAAGANNDDSN